MQFCQCIKDALFIPEFSTIYPKINPSEIAILFAKCQHIIHPEFGLFELQNPIDWQDVLEIPLPQNCVITEPQITAFRPQTIHKIEIKALPPEELLKIWRRTHFLRRKLLQKSHSIGKKDKIPTFKIGFWTSETGDGGKQTEKANWFTKLAYMLGKLIPTGGKLFEKFENDFEDLEKRNRSEMENCCNCLKATPKKL